MKKVRDQWVVFPGWGQCLRVYFSAFIVLFGDWIIDHKKPVPFNPKRKGSFPEQMKEGN